MPRIFVELFAEAILSRYVVIDFPEDATLNELPWEEISEAADSRGIPWEESTPTDVRIIRARSERRHGLRIVTRTGEEGEKAHQISQ